MFESDYQEVQRPDPKLRLRKSIPPFVKRRLVKVYHGRFCFKMPGLRCGPTKTRWKREVGQQETLTLGASHYGVAVGFSLTKTYSESLELEVDPHDSVMPVWCHNDAELHVYTSSSLLMAHRWRKEIKSFFAPDPGFFDGNYHPDDPACGPGRGKKETLPPIAGGAGADAPSIGATIVQLVEPTLFSPVGAGGEWAEPEVVAAAAAQVLEDDLQPAFEPLEDEDFSYSAGAVGLDGAISWFVTEGKPTEQPARLCVSSIDLLARAQGVINLSKEDRGRAMPILAFGGMLGAVSADIRVFAEGDHELWSGSAVVREDRFDLAYVTSSVVVTTLWGTADLSGIPDGVNGFVSARAYDSDGGVIDELQVPFWTEEQPEPVGIGAVAGVVYGS
jgi:hypothetical protein